MYKLTADLHTHSTMSDGKSTIEQNIQTAWQAGLQAIGITDHAPGHLLYGIRDFTAYLAEANRLRTLYADKICVKIGVEANLIGLHGETDIPEDAQDKLDLVILGFHKCARTADFPSFWEYYIHRVITHNARRLRMRATDSYIAALSRGNIGILAHPGYALGIDIPAVAEACKQAGTLFELNVRHKDLQPKDIELAARTGVKFIISSDAHRAENIAVVDSILGKALAAGLSDKEIINIAPV